MAELREYNVDTEIYFPLVTRGGTDFDTTIDGSQVVFAMGDVKITKDGMSPINAQELPEHVGNGIYKLELSASEVTAAHIVVTIISQETVKDWEDQAVNISTYGNSAASMEFNLNESFETALTNALDNVLMSDLPQASPSATASIKYAINFLYELGRNQTKTTSSELAIFKDDGSTKAFKAALNDDGSTFTRGEFTTGA